MIADERSVSLEIIDKMDNKTRKIIFETKTKNIRMRYWSDYTIELKGTIKRDGLIHPPKSIQEFISFTDKQAQIIPALLKLDNEKKLVSLKISKHFVKGSVVGYNIRNLFSNETKILTSKNHGKKVHIFLLCKKQQCTTFYTTMIDFSENDLPFAYLQELIDNSYLRNLFSETEKIDLIKLTIKVLTTRKLPIYNIDYDQITIYDDDVIVADFIVEPHTTTICIPQFLATLLFKEGERVIFLRDNYLATSSICRTDYSVQIFSHLKGRHIRILWGSGLQRTAHFNRFCQLMKQEQKGDYRLLYALANLHHREDFPEILSTFSSFFLNKQKFPLLQEHAITSYHYDLELEKMLQAIFARDIRDEVFVFKEALLSDTLRTTQKIVDWYLVPKNSTHQPIFIELKTIKNHHYRTRKLQRAIDEYDQLRRALPEAGIPVIVFNWTITKRWRYYALSRGVVLLGTSDIIKMHSLTNFFSRIQQVLNLFTDYDAFLIQQQACATSLVKNWLAIGQIPFQDIPKYSFYLQLQIQIVKNLLTYYQVMNDADATNRYHDHQPILITNPQALQRLHQDIIYGKLEIILMEELHHCKLRLHKLPEQSFHQPLFISNKIIRRRETFNLTLLSQLEKDLKILLAMRPYWGALQLLGVRLYHQGNNQGSFFATKIYEFFQQRGFPLARHAILKDSYLHREIDLVVFNPSQHDTYFQKILISCTDKSTIQANAIQAHLRYKLRELCHLTDSLHCPGALFVLVNDQNYSSAMQIQKTFSTQHDQAKQITMIVIKREDLESPMKLTELIKCHREVSFESIYIVKRFLGGFVIYVYRKITVKVKIERR